MEYLGLWNLRIRGQWYRSRDPQGWVYPPNHPSFLSQVKRIYSKPERLHAWEVVPFPSPLHSSASYVYTVDRDEGTVLISKWDSPGGLLRPMIIELNLADLCESYRLSTQLILQYPSSYGVARTSPRQIKLGVSGRLDIDLGTPTPLNEVQERLFADIVFVWRSYIDDPSWGYDSPFFRVLSIALLRLAAWDFEVSFNFGPDLVGFRSIPNWGCPETHSYWFHGFLVILQKDLEAGPVMPGLVAKIEPYLGKSRYTQQSVRVILMSPHHIAFAEVSRGVVLRSHTLMLLSDTSAIRCSPGFRALSRVLSTRCWKGPTRDRERWGFKLPPDILRMILDTLYPHDAPTFAQASSIAEATYYASIPQLKGITVRRFESSVPCCGKCDRLDDRGICCSKCFAWHHLECVSLEPEPRRADNPFVCLSCLESKTHEALDPGGINRFSCQVERKGCPVRAGRSNKRLKLQLAKIPRRRRDPPVKDLSPDPSLLVDYTLLFNGAFSGLAYGLEDDPS